MDSLGLFEVECWYVYGYLMIDCWMLIRKWLFDDKTVECWYVYGYLMIDCWMLIRIWLFDDRLLNADTYMVIWWSTVKCWYVYGYL